MSSLATVIYDDRVPLRWSRLQQRNHLADMCRIAFIIEIAGYKHRGRIVHLSFYSMVGRIGIKSSEIFSVIDGSIFVPPFRRVVERFIAHHIEKGRDAKCGLEEIRSLSDCSTYQ